MSFGVTPVAFNNPDMAVDKIIFSLKVQDGPKVLLHLTKKVMKTIQEQVIH